MRDHRLYDLAVVGAGLAGFSAAITAAELGARVALIGHGRIGGTCVNTGCVPSKNLIRATEALHQARAAARFRGIRAEGRVEDWQTVVRRKDALVSSLRQAKCIDLLPGYNAVRNAGIESLLDAVLSVELAGVYEPHPSVYQLAVDRLGIPADAISFQSSDAWDAYAASAFGMRAVWCNRYGQRPERLPGKPDCEIAALAELPALVGAQR